MKPKQKKLERMTDLSYVLKFAKHNPKLGLTNTEIKEYFADVLYTLFNDWMTGQTCALDTNVTPPIVLCYPEDVTRFVDIRLFNGVDIWD